MITECYRRLSLCMMVEVPLYIESACLNSPQRVEYEKYYSLPQMQNCAVQCYGLGAMSFDSQG